MPASKRPNGAVFAVILGLLLFWTMALVAIAAEPDLSRGDLVTYTPATMPVCLIVWATETGPGGRPYVWAYDRAEPGRAYHLHVGELTRGCA
jgi:hypothetical protein